MGKQKMVQTTNQFLFGVDQVDVWPTPITSFVPSPAAPAVGSALAALAALFGESREEPPAWPGFLGIKSSHREKWIN